MMEKVGQLAILLLNVGFAVSDCCYTYSKFYCSYCSGYCSGFHGSQFCHHGYYISDGGIVGVVIGSLIGLAILITIIVILCSACNKTAGQRGRVVQPQGVAVVNVQAGTSNYYGGATPMMHNNMSYSAYPPSGGAAYPPTGGAAYPPPQPHGSAGVPQPPGYSDPSQVPPPYKM